MKISVTIFSVVMSCGLEGAYQVPRGTHHTASIFMVKVFSFVVSSLHKVSPEFDVYWVGIVYPNLFLLNASQILYIKALDGFG